MTVVGESSQRLQELRILKFCHNYLYPEIVNEVVRRASAVREKHHCISTYSTSSGWVARAEGLTCKDHMTLFLAPRASISKSLGFGREKWAEAGGDAETTYFSFDNEVDGKMRRGRPTIQVSEGLSTRAGRSRRGALSLSDSLILGLGTVGI